MLVLRVLYYYLTGKRFSLKLKGKTDISCITSCLIYGSKKWQRKQNMTKLDTNEMNMFRWIFCIILKERRKIESWIELLGLEQVSQMRKMNSYGGLDKGQVEHTDDGVWVKQHVIVRNEELNGLAQVILNTNNIKAHFHNHDTKHKWHKNILTANTQTVLVRM